MYGYMYLPIHHDNILLNFRFIELMCGTEYSALIKKEKHKDSQCQRLEFIQAFSFVKLSTR